MLAAMTSSCANVSRFERDSLVAFGQPLDGSHESLYYLIRLGFEEPVNARTTSALLRFIPDGPAFALKDLYPELVATYLTPFTPPPQWPDSLKQKAKEYDTYAGGGFHISFREGKIYYLGICSHCAGEREYPIVGTPDGQQFYTLPLTEKQIIEIFGSPDRIYKVNEVRY